jgi:acetate kinase
LIPVWVFTPTGGIPMSSRTGDLDPGVAGYLMQEEKMSPEQFSHLVNHESGLAGISETSSDMRALLKIQATDKRAAEAIGIFCYQARKMCRCICSSARRSGYSCFFPEGLVKNAPEIREGICSNLQFIGVTLDKKRNDHNEAIISGEGSRVIVRVIKTDEELMIARLVCGILGLSNQNLNLFYYGNANDRPGDQDPVHGPVAKDGRILACSQLYFRGADLFTG